MAIRRILLTGSRTWSHRPTIRMALAEVWHPDAILVSGACSRGADALCEACWSHWGGHIERHPANWRPHSTLDRTAGFRRNQAMITLGTDICLAYIQDESAGASHTATLANMAGVRTIVYRATTGTPEITRHDFWPSDAEPIHSGVMEEHGHGHASFRCDGPGAHGTSSELASESRN